MISEHPTRLDRLMQVVAEHHPMHAELRLQFDDFHVIVESNCEALIERLQGYFRHYAQHSDDVIAREYELRVVAIEAPEPDFGLEFQAWPADPQRPGKSEEFANVDGGRVVRQAGKGLQLLLGPDLTLAVGACLRNSQQIINLINARYTERLLDAGWLLCHAAAVAWEGTGLALAGVSGSGKSTLALRLLRHGAQFVSSDRLLVRHVGRHTRMSGLPKLPRVNPGTLLGDPSLRALLSTERAHELSQLSEQALWELEDKHDVDIERVYGPGRIALMAWLRALVVLTWSRESTSPTKVTRTTLGDSPHLISIVAKHPGPFYRGGAVRSGNDSVHALDPAPYFAALKHVPVVEISGALDFELAQRLCIELATPQPVHDHA
jgi:HprK-related kinase B